MTIVGQLVTDRDEASGWGTHAEPPVCVIRNGMIAEVGDKVLAPMGAKIIDLSGKHITPGLIDCHTHIALVSTNEGSVSVSSMVAMRDVIDPEDPAIFRDLAGGTTDRKSTR